MAAYPADELEIDELHKWFEECQLLPKKIDRLLLKRFYYCMYKDVKETKDLILLHYHLRSKNPELFIERDPIDEDTRKTFAYTDMFILPGLTPEKYKVVCFRLSDYDASKVRHAKDTKAFLMIMDARFVMPDSKEDPTEFAVGEVQILDIAGLTLKHIYKLSFGTLRTYIRFLQEAFPGRLKAIHTINCPTYLDKLVKIVKPFISTEVFELIHFHTQGIESLYDHVPREMLPEEYGGSLGKISDHKDQTIQHVLDHREYLLDADYWRHSMEHKF